MKLSVPDRLVLLNVLPKENSVITMRILRDLNQRLSFTEEELAALQFVSTPEKTEWKDAVGEVEILIGPKAHALIIEAFEELDKTKQIRVEFLPVYEKFMEEGKEKEKEEGA